MKLLSLSVLFFSGCGGSDGPDEPPPPLATLSCSSDAGIGEPAVQLDRVFPNLSFSNPVVMEATPDGSKFFLAEKQGVLLQIEILDDVDQVLTVADLSDTHVDEGGEGGLLGLAIPADFSLSRQVYLSYTSSDNPAADSGVGFRTIVSRFDLNDGEDTLDLASEFVFLELPQSFSNHNGGQISFGPDGFLYIGLGDEGGGGDPNLNGQDTATLYGALLRIDVNTTDLGRGANYGIPATNPFASAQNCQSGTCPEIYAWGLRNPWRWSFDRDTGNLWLADVGQDDWEEVNLIEIGNNYGWNCMEGNHLYDNSSCGDQSIVPPIAEYDHSEGFSITGGFVYRGSQFPDLAGIYLFGDFVNGTLWGLTNPYDTSNSCQLLAQSGVQIVSFVQDSLGELYVLGWDGGIYQIGT